MDDIITLDYGSGGKKTSDLIESILLPAFGNETLNDLGDAALLSDCGQMVFSTDSFVITPCFFPGGDIGKLSVCGTVNDLCMAGGTPLWLSLAFIIEEGFSTQSLQIIVNSIAETAKKAGISIVTGDTKVVDKGKGDGIYINTAGIGKLRYSGLSTKKICVGDSVILSGTCGDHGAAIMMQRAGVKGALQSDCAPLRNLTEAVFESGADIRCLRDPTRGGVATVLNEFADDAGVSIILQEELVPVREDVSAVCDLLGLDSLYCANEGKLLCVVSPEDEETVLKAMHSVEEGKNACKIGMVTESMGAPVVLQTAFGGQRILQKLAGAQLPRIC